jgi:hypothetical protein
VTGCAGSYDVIGGRFELKEGKKKEKRRGKKEREKKKIERKKDKSVLRRQYTSLQPSDSRKVSRATGTRVAEALSPMADTLSPLCLQPNFFLFFLPRPIKPSLLDQP